MTARATYPGRAHHADTGAHVVAWFVSLLGFGAAAIGAYTAVAPDDGSLTLMTRTWSTGALVDTWAPWLLIAGGAFAAIGMAVSVIVGGGHAESQWMVAGETSLGLIGLAAIVAGLALLARWDARDQTQRQSSGREKKDDVAAVFLTIGLAVFAVVCLLSKRANDPEG